MTVNGGIALRRIVLRMSRPGRSAQRDPAAPDVSGDGRADQMRTPDDVAELLCREIEPVLIGSLTLYCGDRGIAEELAQETLVRLWDRRDQMQTLGSPAAWAHRVAFNLANSWFRRRQAEARARRRLEARPEQVVEADVTDRLLVRRAVSDLPTRQRTAVVLRYYADMTSVQAAQVMDCSPVTVRTLVHRALHTLRTAGLSVDTTEDDDV